MEFVLPCVYAFFGCLAYSFHFQIRPRKMMLLLAALGGALGWAVFSLLSFLRSDLPRYFLAIVIVGFYAEAMARRFRTPTTIYLIVGMMPLVPGGGIYYTMERCINGETIEFLETGLHTLGIAGALALGILLVSTLVRLQSVVRIRRKQNNVRRRDR